ncbi:MAG: hypothetical protein II588_02280, partial [Paludibacteraceae bacterium]|nr:hypothetical protein [Paludibacteraceae bacterium]
MKAETNAKTVGNIAFFQVGFAKIGNVSIWISSNDIWNIAYTSIIPVVESIHAQTDSENAHRHPICRHFYAGYAVELLTVLIVSIVVLLRASSS